MTLEEKGNRKLGILVCCGIVIVSNIAAAYLSEGRLPRVREFVIGFGMFVGFLSFLALLVAVATHGAYWAAKMRRGVRRRMRSIGAIRRWFPPVVYVWRHDDVLGLFLKRDYDRARRKYWSKARTGFSGGWRGAIGCIIPDNDDILLFSDKVPVTDKGFIIGTLAEMEEILEGCRVERQFFLLPPVSVPSWPGFRRKFNLEQAVVHIHGVNIFPSYF